VWVAKYETGEIGGMSRGQNWQWTSLPQSRAVRGLLGTAQTELALSELGDLENDYSFRGGRAVLSRPSWRPSDTKMAKDDER
jgi:hypothetical protein